MCGGGEGGRAAPSFAHARGVTRLYCGPPPGLTYRGDPCTTKLFYKINWGEGVVQPRKGDSIVCEQPLGSKAENAFGFGGAQGRGGVSAAILVGGEQRWVVLEGGGLPGLAGPGRGEGR